MRFDIITLFPEIIDSFRIGLVGKAQQKNLIQVQCWNPRAFSTSPHKQVDDRPYGGEPGMVLQYQPIVDTLNHIKKTHPYSNQERHIVYLCPAGKPFNQSMISSFKKTKQLILIAGRYEGIDQRIIDHHVDALWSTGPYVLSGGELPACAIVDAMSRSIDGVLGNKASYLNDTLSDAYPVKHPVYTRPRIIDGHAVPEALLSGDPKKILQWQDEQRNHNQQKPDLSNQNSTT